MEEVNHFAEMKMKQDLKILKLGYQAHAEEMPIYLQKTYFDLI